MFTEHIARQLKCTQEIGLTIDDKVEWYKVWKSGNEFKQELEVEMELENEKVR